MKINFDLADEQIQKTQLLVRQAYEAASGGLTNRGIIFAQINHNQVSAKFIKAKTAGKIIAILREDGYGD
jgi:hypothetical protein